MGSLISLFEFQIPLLVIILSRSDSFIQASIWFNLCDLHLKLLKKQFEVQNVYMTSVDQMTIGRHILVQIKEMASISLKKPVGI